MKTARTSNLFNGHRHIFRLLTALIFAVLPYMGFSQIARDSVPSFDSLTVENDRDIDSTFFIVYNRYGNQIALAREDTDSTQNYWNHVPAFKGDRMYYTLGNTGSPALSAYWKPVEGVGFDPGIHHLDLYRLRSEDVKFFGTDRAYTSLHYNQTPQKTKSATNILFGRAFDTKSGISLQYDRINDIGEYPHQKTRETSVGVGMYYLPAENKKIFFSYTSNNFTIEENGGIQSPSFFDDPTYDDRDIFPVRIYNSLAEIKEREARLTATWNLGTTNDTLTKGVSILYDGSYNSFRYKYADPDTSVEVYQQYLVHPDGERAYVQDNEFRNYGAIILDYGSLENTAFNGRLTAGIEHQYHKYTQDFETTSFNNLIVKGGLEQRLSQRIRLTADLSIDLGDQAGDYLLRGKLAFTPLHDIYISGHLSSRRRTPTGIQQSFRSLNYDIYDFDYSPATYNSLGGKIEYRPLGVSAEINNTIVTDHVYFSERLQPEVINDAFNILQIKLALKKQFGILYTENYVYLQNSSDARLPLPTFFSKHFIGTRVRLFRQRLQLDTGLDGIFLPDFDGYGYFPMTGQFYPAAQFIPYNYTINGILGFRIDQFNIYVKFENMHTFWDDTPRYLVEDYPVYDFRLRIGFRWLLRG